MDIVPSTSPYMAYFTMSGETLNLSGKIKPCVGKHSYVNTMKRAIQTGVKL